MTIVTVPDPRLRLVSSRIADPTSVKDVAESMIKLMEQARGVGLAAPQVGLNIRLFIACETGKASDATVYINPKLLVLSGTGIKDEGCLSIPKVILPILRYTTAEIEAYDINGKQFREVSSSLLARIWQHEIDHLNGILITDKPSIEDL